MRQKLKTLISFSTLKYVSVIFVIIYKVKNWIPFILNYLGLNNSGELYKLRNGIKFRTKDGISAATIASVFLKEVYGPIPNDAVIIDIGANIGAFSILTASIAKNVKVYAYEPMADNFDLLLNNIRINKLDKIIKPFNLGISQKCEERKLYLNNRSSGHSLYSKNKHQGSINVRCISLKQCFDKNKIDICHLLKMDCEGAEFEILYNTPHDYFYKIKEIRMEWHNQSSKRDNVDYLKSFLEEKGFTMTKFKRDSDHTGILWAKRVHKN